MMLRRQNLIVFKNWYRRHHHHLNFNHNETFPGILQQLLYINFVATRLSLRSIVYARSPYNVFLGRLVMGLCCTNRLIWWSRMAIIYSRKDKSAICSQTEVVSLISRSCTVVLFCCWFVRFLDRDFAWRLATHLPWLHICNCILHLDVNQ